MSSILNSPEMTAGPSQERLDSVLGGMSPVQLFEVTSQMKALVQSNPAAARQVLIRMRALLHDFKADAFLNLPPEHRRRCFSHSRTSQGRCFRLRSFLAWSSRRLSSSRVAVGPDPLEGRHRPDPPPWPNNLPLGNSKVVNCCKSWCRGLLDAPIGTCLNLLDNKGFSITLLPFLTCLTIREAQNVFKCPLASLIPNNA